MYGKCEILRQDQNFAITNTLKDYEIIYEGRSVQGKSLIYQCGHSQKKLHAIILPLHFLLCSLHHHNNSNQQSYVIGCLAA
jgi:hypothetical protein